MVIEPSLDTGKLLAQKGLKIAPDETTPSLTNKLIQLSNQLLGDYLPRYVNGELKARSQPHPDRATYSRKLTKEDGIIDWHKSAQQLEREIRAFVGWPRSRTQLAGKEVILCAGHIEKGKHAATFEVGAVITDEKQTTLSVVTGDGLLQIDRLQPAGKKEMSAQAFLAGNKV